MFKRFFKWIKRGIAKLKRSKPQPPVVIPEPRPLPDPVPGDQIAVDAVAPQNYPDVVFDPVVNESKPNWHYIATKIQIDHDAIEKVQYWVGRARTAKERYQDVSLRLGGLIPWEFIAFLHYRESSLSFDGVLHNGQRIIGTNKKTTWVPKGRGPFLTWEEAAIDALKLKGFERMRRWKLGDCLERSERNNGLGYRRRTGDMGKVELSPYVAAYTTYHDEDSKYVSDGRYSRNAPEAQLGCAAFMLGLGYPRN
jgi:lysozyme family protein